MTRRGTIVYVHGSSDRAAQVADHVARIEQQLALAGMAFDVLPSRWGEAAGADLSRVELALPSVEVRVQAPSPACSRWMTWPSWPPSRRPTRTGPTRRRRGARPMRSSKSAAQVGRPGESIQLADGSAVAMAAACHDAADSVARSSEYAAARSSAASEERLIDAAGRAVVATAAAGAASPVEVALAQPNAPRPDLLVTVGSQAPLLATFGARHPLRGPGTPSPFQPWLNVFDRRDVLGFVAGRLWPDQRGITDTEVDLGVGFPDSHGATYLSNPQVVRAIREHPALATNGAREREHHFPLRVGSLSAPARIVLGVRPDNSSVEIAGGIHIRMGRIAIEVPLGSAHAWHTVDKARRGRTLIGVVTALLGGVAALGSSEGKGVRVVVRPPARWVLFPLHLLELAVEDPERLGRALSDHEINADANDRPSDD